VVIGGTLPPSNDAKQSGQIAPGPLLDLIARQKQKEREERHLVADQNGGWDLVVSPWHLDEYISAFPVPQGMAASVSPVLPAGWVPGRMNQVHQAVADAVAQVKRPLVLSGDCPVALGVVAGLQRRLPDLAVVWLDAHGDFNTPSITTSGYLGGMPLAMLTGREPDLFAEPLGLRAIPESSMILAGARDLDPAERAALTASEVRRVPADPAALIAALEGLRGRPVYLHLDVDVIDSTELADLRFPSGPGPSLAQVADCLAAVCSNAEVAAASVACAWLPHRVGDEPSRAAITQLAGALGVSLSWS
jgi:arginase